MCNLCLTRRLCLRQSSSYLLWIAYGTWKQFRNGVTIGAKSATSGSQQALTRGIVMGFLSPGPYLFWSTVNGPLLLEALEQSYLHAFFLSGVLRHIFGLHGAACADVQLCEAA